MTNPYASEPSDEQKSRGLHLSVGAMSPLWPAFMAAAGAGAAFWWLTRWTRTEPRSFTEVEEPAHKPASEPAFEAAPVQQAAQAVDAAAEAVVETFPQAEAEPQDGSLQTAAPQASASQPAAEDAAAKEGEAVEAAPKPTLMATPLEKTDDLTRIAGVGPKLAAALAQRGVKTFAEIAAWSAEELASIDRDLDLKGRAVRMDWVEQAKTLAHAAHH
jgi:predicted flap endonuclease-1-like 5' DNA nuclease